MPRKQKFNSEQKKQIYQEYLQNSTYKGLAKKHNASLTTIKNVIEDMKVQAEIENFYNQTHNGR